MSTALLVAVLALLAFVAAYGLAYVGLSFALLRRNAGADAPRAPRGRGHAVTVLIPAHHEGAALIDTVQSVLAQDYRGPIAIWLLVDDDDDDAIPALRAAFPHESAGGAHDLLVRRADREVHLFRVGRPAKRDKLVFALSRLEAPFVALLDADHRADARWLSTAVARLAREGCAAVQSRRWALSRSRLVEIWDAAESHLGNEAINAVLGQDFTFFTGTTAVFRREILTAHGIPDCVTEDTYLSWQCLLAGERIGYESGAGSYEEVAPSLRAFVARRRRWAAGHTKSFFHHARGLLRARLGVVRTLRFALYGGFFLVPVAVVALLDLQAAHVLVQLAGRSLLAALGGAVGLAIFAAAALTRRLTPAALLAGVACALPLATAATVGGLALTGSEAYFTLLQFPWSRTLGWVELALWWVPVLPLLAGNRRLRALPWRELGLVILSWPFAVLVNLYAGTLGFVDFCRGRSVWSKIERRNVVSPGAVPAPLARRLATASTRRFRWRTVGGVAAALLAVLVFNDLLASNECGVQRSLFWPPLLLRPGAPVTVDVDIATRVVDADTGSLWLTVDTSSEQPRHLDLSVTVDGRPRRQLAIDGAHGHVAYEETFPLGWSTRRVGVTVRGPGASCRIERAAPTSVKELRDGTLAVNGEPFLIKGVIPSFSAAPLSLPMRDGLAEIKRIGANAVRFYHRPSPDTLEALSHAELLALVQPNESTWQDVDVTDEASRARLARRYLDLLSATDGSPFVLADNLGNELELERRREPAIAAIREAIAALPRRRFPLSYSTYLTFVDYPVDILGVNMLDTGSTYWGKGLEVLRRMHRPFYATELGGFVAFFERPSAALRMRRLEANWQRVLTAGALGAFIYESHDNWAQSVPPGTYNDPLQPEMPDDTRGLWDRRNEPKPELALVKRLLADVDVEVSERRADGLTAAVTNRRPYALRAVEARLGEARAALGDLAPGETRIVSWALRPGGPAAADALFDYRTHHGLAGQSSVAIAVRADAPTVLNDDFVATGAGTGYLWRSSTLELLLPGNQRRSVPLGDVVRAVEDLEWSTPGRPWGRWQPGAATGGGPTRFRFRLPPATGAGCTLLLAGVGADRAVLTVADRPHEIETHPYRELGYDLGALGARAGDPATLAVDRRQLEYIAGRVLPDGRPVTIDFDPPIVFCPHRIDLARLPM